MIGLLNKYDWTAEDIWLDYDWLDYWI